MPRAAFADTALEYRSSTGEWDIVARAAILLESFKIFIFIQLIHIVTRFRAALTFSGIC
jgi:hypothetical protein